MLSSIAARCSLRAWVALCTARPNPAATSCPSGAYPHNYLLLDRRACVGSLATFLLVRLAGFCVADSCPLRDRAMPLCASVRAWILVAKPVASLSCLQVGSVVGGQCHGARDAARQRPLPARNVVSF